MSSRFLRPLVCLFAVGSALALPTFAAGPVTLTEVDETIPTYLSGPPDPNPMFYFGRQSQGAEGRTYPYPLYNNLLNRKADQSYRLVYLENEYVKIGIAPGLGGRVFSAVDGTNNYDYVYKQHVIKPALIGLIGAWISGGIEWNIPHHHRASTFLPVQYRTQENADGSKTVWVGELEIRHRMRWAVGYTLRPGSSVLECSLRILNRTPSANTMLCFANVAVNTNENYQILFPPSTQWVTHHHKREFTTWPVATKPYGGVDWQNVDVSWYKNHQAANSMFAWNYQDDFFAGYDHGKQAGTMSIADHHIVPGKKFWTWGNGPRGRMWDEILTDTDGPYIELMVGAYSDNQPDYSWLQPYAARSFEMYWYPFRDIGGAKNANREAAVNLEVKNGVAHYGFYTTKAHAQATARLTARGKLIAEETFSIDPARPRTREAALPVCAPPAAIEESDLRVSLSVGGRELIAYSPMKLVPTEMPALVKTPPAPKEFKTEEELYLAGQRIDQFHDPDRDPEPYWEEALRRDPANTEANTGLGRIALRKARYAEAEKYFRAALVRLTAKHTTPKNVEPLYYLGVTLKAQDRNDEAYDAFFKTTWSQEWAGPAYYALAEIAAGRGQLEAALDFANRALDANALNPRAHGLKVSLLRHLKRDAEAREALSLATLKTDPLDVRFLAEAWLLAKSDTAARPLFATLNEHLATAQELAAEYDNAGLWSDAITVLAQAVAAPGPAQTSPILHYYLADFSEKLGDTAKAAAHRRTAAQLPPDYVFPFQAELIPVLRRAIAANPQDARAAYYLGNLLFDWQPGEAIALWEKSAALDPSFAIVWRNLAHAYTQVKTSEGRERAIAAFEKAVALPNPHPTHLAEIDLVYAAAKTAPAKRLALLEKNQGAIGQHDEALARVVNLKIFAGKADEAIALLTGHTFNIWEGGTRFSTADSWIDAHLVRGISRLNTKRAREALADFETAAKFPPNLRAFDNGARAAELAYWQGRAHEALGDTASARSAWERVAAAKTEVQRRNSDVEISADVLFRQSTQRYLQALALRKLGREEKAAAAFQELAKSGAAALPEGNPAGGTQTTDTGDVARRAAAGHYAKGLSHAGLGEKEKARAELETTLTEVPDSLPTRLALDSL
jgi:tetratricopeptide (TPR) repeat protein